MKRKIIKIGNSAGIMLPKNVREEAGLKLGDNVGIEYNAADQSIVVNKAPGKKTTSITPRFLHIVEKVNKRYAAALKELAGK